MIFKSPYPDIAIPEVPLADFILERAPQLSLKPALIDGATRRTLNYGELIEAVDRVAASLAARGFQKGDVCAIHCLNCPEYAIAFLAVARVGGVCTMISPLFNESELTTQLTDSGANYLLTDSRLGTTGLAAARATGVREVFVLGEAEGATSFSTLLDQNGAAPPVEIDPRRDIVALPYSSGTTGWPKGVMLTHYNMVAMLCLIEATGVLSGEDRTICAVPCYHLYGSHIVMNMALRTGATVVTLPHYDLETFLRTIQDYEISVAPAVPPIVLELSRSPLVDGFDLSSLTTVFSGAAPLSVEVAKACCDRLKVRINYGYGMTELSPLSHLTYRGAGSDKPESTGYCLPNTFCKIVDVETKAELQASESGEIWVRGPQVMKGYLGQPEATAEIIDREGWLHTGDIGYADEDGALYIVDRLKELIKYKGRQVAPAELEALLLSHPAISDAAVIPSPDADAGEIPVAFIVVKENVSADDIINFVRERVAPHKKIRRVEFVDHIPKNATGKILRRVLVERVRKSARQ
jgi:acyl-CoA synthetase (AMP-forming)/AMP-acid ligase II